MNMNKHCKKNIGKKTANNEGHQYAVFILFLKRDFPPIFTITLKVREKVRIRLLNSIVTFRLTKTREKGEREQVSAKNFVTSNVSVNIFHLINGNFPKKSFFWLMQLNTPPLRLLHISIVESELLILFNLN